MTSERAASAPIAAVAPLAARRIAIDTWRENVAYLRRDCPLVHAEGFQPLAKVQVQAACSSNGTSNGARIAAVLNVVDDPRLLEACDLGLSEQAFAQLGVADGAPVQIAHAEPPASAGALRRKLRGERLGREDLQLLVRDIADRRYSKIELAAFIVATQQVAMDRDEVLHLTAAMAEVGEHLTWRAAAGARSSTPPLIVDKHCIGGIPGNRTAMIVVPIVAVHALNAGLLMPKTSSRAITSPAGTADTMACLAEVELPLDRLQAIVATYGACLAWGGRARLSPADDVLISVSRPLSIDAPGQMVASILSKKIAAGVTHLLLDIPLGPTAKVRSAADAQHLRQLFEYVAGHLGLTLEVMITDGHEPIGRGIGPVLETRDVLQVLRNDPRAPADLRHKAIALAGRVLEFDPQLRGGEGERLAERFLASGQAWERMQAIIAAQGAVPFDAEHPPLAPLTADVNAAADGIVVAIDNERLARIARLAGAPKAPGAGVDLFCKRGAAVTRGAPLYRIYAASSAELAFALQAAQRASGYALAAAPA